MESIQLAQMLADLSDLNAAQEAQAAVALVNANKNAASAGPTAADAAARHMDPPPVRPGQRHHQRVNSSSSIISRTASPAKFDKLGRRLYTPPLSRTNSAQGSIPGTPRKEDPEDDVERATSLMALYDIRAKLKQQDNTSLVKLREKIAALQARQQAEKKDGGAATTTTTATADGRHSRYTYPKASS
ncbi:hypothetical protein B0T17DRAFT_341545 [Bombardia bombarda]|uniref:Uncharacterized protein n=1 Tax=Bombardia bombarda TaxID=252184 RepID=A0AA40BYV1_9PEZI|nr:hypothetical protein B0T17DRAFT_341545 [Bombardia bombarda]